MYIMFVCLVQPTKRSDRNDRQYNIAAFYIHKTYSLGLGEYFITFRNVYKECLGCCRHSNADDDGTEKAAMTTAEVVVVRKHAVAAGTNFMMVRKDAWM